MAREPLPNPAPDNDHRTYRRWTGCAFALLALHAALSIPFPWEPISFTDRLLSANPDFVLLVAVACAASLWRGRRRLTGHLCALTALCLVVYRVADSAMPVILEKNFDPYNDVLLIRGLTHLLLHELPEWQQWAAWAGFGLAVAGSYYVLARVCTRIVADLSTAPRVYALLAVCQLLVLIGWVQKSAGAEPRLWEPSVARKVIDRSIRTVREQPWLHAEEFAARVAEAKADLDPLPKDMGRLAGADVYLIFIESYGAALFRGDRRTEAVHWCGERQRELGDAGFRTCSGFVTPSNRGGGSGYTHAQLLSGVKIENLRDLGLLLETDLVPLPKLLHRIGYRTVNVQPAMTQEWREGQEFFGFDSHVFQNQLDYSGCVYSWGRMPDQFALNRILETEVRGATSPLFVQYVSVSSHSPFAQIPAYAEDWSVVADPAVFRGEPVKTYDINWQSYLKHPKTSEAYTQTVGYSFRAATGFARQLTRPSLVLILGDHQPPPVRPMTDADKSFDVPMHVVSNRDQLLAPFRGWGFVDGLVPADDCEPFDTTEVLPRLLRDFAGTR